MEELRRVTSVILDSGRPARSLAREVDEMTKIFAEARTRQESRREEISGRETRTENGLALSPTLAAMCAEDFVRTVEFLRGTRAAIRDARARFPDRPVRVLYAGCGPYATLAVPLMTVFSPSEATFTLLDVHSESIESVRTIVKKLGLADSVAKSKAVDAGTYEMGADQPPDVLLLEIMQACLESEPQVAVTRHLLRQAPQAILVPEEVRIDLELMDYEDHEDRIPVGSIFAVNRQTVASWSDMEGLRLPASRVRLPKPVEQRYEPMLLTTIRVYKDHVLQGDDSDYLTSPRYLSIEDPLSPGDTVQFHYELGARPGLKGAKSAASSSSLG